MSVKAILTRIQNLSEPPHDKTNKMACAPSEDPDAQAYLSLRWAQMSFCWFCHEVAQVIMYSWRKLSVNHQQLPTLSVPVIGLCFWISSVRNE